MYYNKSCNLLCLGHRYVNSKTFFHWFRTGSKSSPKFFSYWLNPVKLDLVSQCCQIWLFVTIWATFWANCKIKPNKHLHKTSLEPVWNWFWIRFWHSSNIKFDNVTAKNWFQTRFEGGNFLGWFWQKIGYFCVKLSGSSAETDRVTRL